MRATLLFFLIFISAADSFCQNRNSVWCFGDSAGIDFSSGAPVTFASGMDGRGSCTSVADNNSNLLFYAFTRAGIGAFTTYVFDSTHQLMQNGDLIAGEAWYNELVITPMPDSANQFYLFSSGISAPNKGFYYSIVDMNQNGGLGAVTQKNIQLNTFRNADCVQAIKHGNGRDWWVFSKYSNPNGTKHNRFYVYLISPLGISAPIMQDMDSSTDVDFQKIIFNSIGTKFMLINELGFMCEYDFNRCTGIISNPNVIYPEQTSFYSRFFWEGAYSPSDKVFYVSAIEYPPSTYNNYVLQYNLNSANISQSVDTLDINIWPPTGGGALRLAPNGKIYYSNWYVSSTALAYPYADTMYNYVNMNLGVINYPDSLGNMCDFQPFSFNLGGKRTYLGLPNNPNYDLGALTGSICDSLTGIGLTPVLPEGEGALYVYYNPVWQKAFINAKGLKGRNAKMSVFDLLGNVVYTDLTSAPSTGEGGGGGYFTKDLNMAAFAKGMYIVSLETDKERLVKKFIKD
jgi:hypothetical protein